MRPPRAGLLAVLVFAPTACHPPAPAARADVYEGCLYTVFPVGQNGCADGKSTCVATQSQAAVGVCTVECVTDDDCPSVGGTRGTCESFTRGGRVCAVTCDPTLHFVSDESGGCPVDTTCTEVTRLNGRAAAYCLAT